MPVSRALFSALACSGFVLALAAPSRLTARAPQAATAATPTHFDQDAAAIFALLNRQAADWNRGNLDAFATGYKNAPDILFIGRTTEHGYAGMLAGYKAHYPTPEAMGKLSFTQLDAQRLDAHFATATGQFHLLRSANGGGNSNGFFLLVLEKTAAGWKIVRDDTTVLPPS
jgi:hypothetical protein